MAYPEEMKAACIAAHKAGMSTRQIESIYGCDHASVSQWVNGNNVSSLAFSMSDEFQKDLAQKWEKLSHLAVQQAADTMDKAGPYQAAMIGAVAVDKMRLLREQPTQIHRTTEERRLALIALLSPSEPPLIESETVTEPGQGEAPSEG